MDQVASGFGRSANYRDIIIAAVVVEVAVFKGIKMRYTSLRLQISNHIVLTKQTLYTLLAGACLSLSTVLMAGSGDSATTYGLGPINVGSAMAFSPFQSDAWAVYYNPAAMTRSTEGQIAVVMQHGEQELRAASLGGNAPLARAGDVLSDQSSQLLLLGVKTTLSGALSGGDDYSFGLNIGVDEHANNFLPYSASTSREGQFLRYESQPLYLALAGAKRSFLPGIDVGIGARLTLSATASLDAVSDLAGNTDSESLSLNAEPSLTPIIGVNIRPQKLFCGSSDCLPELLNDSEVALFWRGDAEYEVSVDANVVIPGVVPAPGLDLVIVTLDSYQPEVIGAAILIPVGKFELVGSLEQQKWSELGEKFAGDTVRNQAALRFKDISVPRLGVSYQWNERLKLIGGISKEDSPLKGNRSQDVNYFDVDKVLIGVGASYRFNRVPGMSLPVEVGLGYQFQMLDERDFELTNINSPTDPAPYETVRVDGDIHVLSASLALRF
tara:strand:- start:64522 stop:66012 length:1491 start_codon:yes stop_codon:yes gene_type:complete